MARTYSFSVIRLAPDDLRGEAINVGVVIFHDREVDVRFGEVLTRARVLYPEMSGEVVREAVDTLKRLGASDLTEATKQRALHRVGVFTLGEPGHFTCEDDRSDTYEKRIAALMAMFVRSPRIQRQPSQQRLVTDVRRIFRSEKILANVGDASAITEHKIVPDWPLPNRPSLRADLALKNRAMRVCEIVELKMEGDQPPPAGLFAGVITLEVAKATAGATQCVFAYRASGPRSKIDEALAIARLQATDVVNWDSKVDRENFLHDWISAAHEGAPPTAN